MRHLLRHAAAIALAVLTSRFGVAAPGDALTTVVLTADRDATLFEDPAGQLASGVGADLYVGRTNQSSGSSRRALVHFDLSAIPPDARVEAVRLTLTVTQATSRPGVITVHRLLADWGEGASASIGGSGAPAAAGDATWVHRFFDPLAPAPPAPPAPPRSPPSPQISRWLWRTPGGDFIAQASASLLVPGTGQWTWRGPGLVADVERMRRGPRRNHGWLLVGDETRPSTARRMGSRENALPDLHPRLEVVYRR